MNDGKTEFDEQVFTQVTAKALTLSQAFGGTFARTRLGQKGYAPELTAPDGPSTGGGKQATQPLRLVPDEQGAPVLVVGFANPESRTADLRSFEYVDSQHRQRFGGGIDLTRAQYEGFLAKAKSFFRDHGFEVSVVDAPVESTVSDRTVITPRPPAPSRWVPFAAGVLVGVVAVAGLLRLGSVGGREFWVPNLHFKLEDTETRLKSAEENTATLRNHLNELQEELANERSQAARLGQNLDKAEAQVVVLKNQVIELQSKAPAASARPKKRR